MNPTADEIRQLVFEAGFDAAGICAAQSVPRFDYLRNWIEEGKHGGMSYIPDRLQAYQHPKSIMDGVQSIVVLTTSYETAEPRSPDTGTGRVARYAWGSVDYHDLIHRRFKHIKRTLKDRYAELNVRGIVDTAPMLEREFAVLAGLGWIGKNTLLINPARGSYFFLSALLLSCPLPADDPFDVDHCGTCRACLDACPTDAFPAPYQMDATRCISYLTIEHPGTVDESLRQPIGEWAFGCDICQEVCPWNSARVTSLDHAFQPLDASNPLKLIELFELDEEAFRKRFRKTPIWRTQLHGMLRNAAYVLGNQRCKQAIDVLTQALEHQDPAVRDACRWALQQING